MQLYVAGNSANSHRAKNNLEEILKLLQESVPFEIIDVLQFPKLALEERIFATPSLILTIDRQKILIVGDLSDHSAVLNVLRGPSR